MQEKVGSKLKRKETIYNKKNRRKEHMVNK